MLPRASITLLALSSLASAHGQVWIVDDGGGPGVDFTTVQGAVDAAADGDVLVVRAGFYGVTLVLGRSLTIVAEAGQEPVLSQLTIQSTPLGGKVVVRGLTIVSPPETPGTTIESNPGLVWLEDFTTRGAPAGDIRGTNRDVVAIRASFLGHDGKLPLPFIPLGPIEEPGYGVRIVNLTFSSARSITLQDCILRGGTGATAYYPGLEGQWGRPGLQGPMAFPPSSCEIIAAGCTFAGGHGGSGHMHPCDPFSPPGCTPACTSGGAGGTGFSAYGILYEQDCTYTAGSPGFSISPCGPGSGGTPKFFGGTEVAIPGPVRSYEVSSPVREAQTIQLDFQGVPGDLAYLLFHTAFDPFYLGPCQGSILPSLAPGLIILFVGAVDGTGALSAAVPAPALGPGVESLVAATQANLVSPDVACHATTGSAFVLLDSAF